MGLKHGFGITVLALLLLPTLFITNVMIGVDRTVLNQDFVTETLEEDDAYGAIVEIASDQLPNASDQAPVDPEAILTEEFIQTEVEKNIDNFYSYIYKDDENLTLTINLSQVHEAIADNVTASDNELLQQLDPELVQMRANESAFEQIRTERREQIFQRIQDETDEDRNQQELELAFEDRKDTIRQELQSKAQQNIPEDLQEPIIKVLNIKIDAILNESITYDAFKTDLDTTLDEVGPTLVSAMLEQEVGLPQQVDLTERMDEQLLTTMDQGRDYLQYVQTGIYVLPLIVLIFIGLLVKIAHTRSGGLASVGIPIAIVGGVSATGFVFAKNKAVEQITQTVPDQAPTAAAKLAGDMIAHVLNVFITQSAVLLGLGVVLILAALAFIVKK